jgi:hypothetical protein
LFPNPSHGSFNMRVTGIGRISKIVLFNSQGIIYREIMPLPEVFDFQFKDIPKGVYTIFLEGKENHHSRKILIH